MSSLDIKEKYDGSIGIANIPNQIHEIITREGVSLNVFCIGDSNSGKKSFLSQLFGFNVCDDEEEKERNCINKWSYDVVEAGFMLRLGISIGTSKGNEEEIVSYIEKNLSEHMKQGENVLIRKHTDKRIHLCMFFVSINTRNLSEKTLSMLKKISKITNLVVLIAKADTLTINEKRRVYSKIKKQLFEKEVSIYETEEIKQPLFVIGGSKECKIPRHVRVKDESVVGRKYPWGVVDAKNKEVCDFETILDLLIRKETNVLMKKTESFYEEYQKEFLGSDSLK